MPVRKCQINGKDGYKWGNDGKCYTGANAKAKAEEQGRAVESSRAEESKKKKGKGKDSVK